MKPEEFPLGGGEIDWADLVARTIHPVKVAILEALDHVDRPLSATELSELLREGGFSFDSIHYHLVDLSKMRIVTKVVSRQGHSPRERHYRLAYRSNNKN